MSYLDSVSTTVDAILTKKGRELMANGAFNITQFALADDEIDYSMYATNHPSGSAFYGEAIQNMPLLQAIPDETNIMKYKLITLPRGTSKLPVINVGYSAISLKQAASIVINPSTLNYLGSNNTFEPSGYVCTIGDSRLLSTFTGIGIDTSNLSVNDLQSTVGGRLSKTQIGTSFTLMGTTIDTLFGSSNTSISTTITVMGRDSGARITIPITIIKK
jgi:hypothetical protein